MNILNYPVRIQKYNRERIRLTSHFSFEIEDARGCRNDVFKFLWEIMAPVFKCNGRRNVFHITYHP